MSLLKVSDNYSAAIVGNFSSLDTTITVSIAPVKTAGYLTVFDLNGNQFEKIKYTGVSGLNLTGCIRGLSFDDNSDTPVVGFAQDLKNGMAIKMTVTQHYLNPVIDFVNQYDGKWMGAVANYAALVALVSPQDGEVRVTLDDDKLYIYDLTTATWILAGAGGGAGTVYRTTLLGTESTGDDNKTFTMTSGSFPDKKYLQVYKNGVLMGEGASNDYVATGSNQAVFNDVVLDDDVITLLVVSVDLYNPAWNSVNADVLPDVTATHSIGSTLKKFTTGFFSGIVTALSFSGDGANLDDGANGKLTSGTTANKLVRLDANAKLPAVDGSQLTGIYTPFEQDLIFDGTTNASQISTNSVITSNNDGSVVIIISNPTSNSWLQITRLEKDVIGSYKVTHTVLKNDLPSTINSSDKGVAIVGNYVYINVNISGSSAKYVYRYLLADLTGYTDMTKSGTFYGGNAFSDGTYYYINTGTGNIYAKYSISGTTITNTNSNVTFTLASGTAYSSMCDGTYVYLADNSLVNPVYKYNLTGGVSIASKTLSIISGLSNESKRQIFFMGNNAFSSSRVYNVESNSAILGSSIKIKPFILF